MSHSNVKLMSAGDGERGTEMNNTGENFQEDRRVLLMLSGGRDSFLSACFLIEEGYQVYMVTYDNGCISDIGSTKTVAERIIGKYGSSRAVFVGVQSIAANLYRLQEAYLYQTVSENSGKYPNLRPAQMPCLACHTGMYLEAIAYCKAHGICYLAEGARRTQKFFVELPEMVRRYGELTEQNGIKLVLPVYDLINDWERKLKLADRGYIPKTLEPQCWIGCPLREELKPCEIESLAAYYDNEMKPKLQGLIDEKVKVYSCDELACGACGEGYVEF